MGIEAGKTLLKQLKERCKDEKELETIDELIDDFWKVLQAKYRSVKEGVFVPRDWRMSYNVFCW